MRTIKMILAISFISLNALGQIYFNGTIDYKYSVETLNPKIPLEILVRTLGTESKFYFQNGNFLQVYKDGKMEFDFLNIIDKKYYKKNRSNDTIYVSDAAVYNGYKLIRIQNLKETKTILGNICKRVDLEMTNVKDGNNYTMTYYYSDKLPINKSLKKGIKYAFREDLYNVTGSLPLEYKMTSKTFVLTSTAIKIEKLDNLNILNDFKNRIKGLPLKIE